MLWLWILAGILSVTVAMVWVWEATREPELDELLEALRRLNHE